MRTPRGARNVALRQFLDPALTGIATITNRIGSLIQFLSSNWNSVQSKSISKGFRVISIPFRRIRRLAAFNDPDRIKRSHSSTIDRWSVGLSLRKLIGFDWIRKSLDRVSILSGAIMTIHLIDSLIHRWVLVWSLRIHYRATSRRHLQNQQRNNLFHSVEINKWYYLFRW